jgi:NADH-quinone oxidoreductase subunit N
MAIFMFSLAGMPPFAGFFAKFFVFAAAVQGGWSWLAAIAMLNSAIGAYYYLRITVSMYFNCDAKARGRRGTQRKARARVMSREQRGPNGSRCLCS